ncbi:hypothetical protein E5288_WYG006762 [Bos mutus]|uniref:Uncharacterized protein n=1 Tax=Bos mutus TaxID=72004 RepID=A0A6B0RMH9_9CETA|nr:hypothetical protein [Bos mutus]
MAATINIDGLLLTQDKSTTANRGPILYAIFSLAACQNVHVPCDFRGPAPPLPEWESRNPPHMTFQNKTFQRKDSYLGDKSPQSGVLIAGGQEVLPVPAAERTGSAACTEAQVRSDTPQVPESPGATGHCQCMTAVGEDELKPGHTVSRWLQRCVHTSPDKPRQVLPPRRAQAGKLLKGKDVLQSWASPVLRAAAELVEIKLEERQQQSLTHGSLLPRHQALLQKHVDHRTTGATGPKGDVGHRLQDHRDRKTAARCL